MSDQGFTHTHNHEDHSILAAEVDTLALYIHDFYINHHNGDKEMNKRIIAVRDKATEIKALLRAHLKNTQLVDHYAEKGYKTAALQASTRRIVVNIVIGVATAIAISLTTYALMTV